MGPDVLLINPPCTEESPSVPHEVGEPIGLCYLAAALRAHGITVEVLDGFTLGLSIVQLVELTHAYEPRVCVGISVLETSALASASYVRELRASGFKGHICAGNYYPTLNPERTFALAPSLDSIVRGEGEHIFVKLVDHLQRNDEGWHNLPGICRMHQGLFVDNGLATQPPIDEIFEPVRDCLSQTLDAGGTANLVTGRGCYANCSFCSIVAFTGAAGKRYRVRDECAVVEEMARISRDFGVRRFLIPDDNFMLPGKDRAPRVHRFCEAIEARQLDLEFTITCRADDIHDDLISRLKANGLVGVYLGIESFLLRRLKLFNKGLKPEENFRAFDILDRNGIFVKLGFIMYDPFVVPEELIYELETLRKRVSSPTVIHTSIDNLIRHSTYPLELQAGTPVQKKLSKLGRAFEVGAGYDYCFDSPESYALSRFAAGLLRLEGPTFALLRALSYRLCFGKLVDSRLHGEVDEECTRLWKAFGAAHFATYIEAVRQIGLLHSRDTLPVFQLVQSHQLEIERLRVETLEVIRRSGFTDIERPWVRFVEVTHGDGLGLVFDPPTGTWHKLPAAARSALRLWSRTAPEQIREELTLVYGESAAMGAIRTISSMVDTGQFAGKREVEAPLRLHQFQSVIEEIMADLRAGRIGLRPGDFVAARDFHRVDEAVG